MMLSQRAVLRERDCYSVSAAKFLSLTPSCCSPDIIPPPLRQLDGVVWSKIGDGAHHEAMGKKNQRKRCPEAKPTDSMARIDRVVALAQYEWKVILFCRLRTRQMISF